MRSYTADSNILTITKNTVKLHLAYCFLFTSVCFKWFEGKTRALFNEVSFQSTETGKHTHQSRLDLKLAPDSVQFRYTRFLVLLSECYVVCGANRRLLAPWATFVVNAFWVASQWHHGAWTISLRPSREFKVSISSSMLLKLRLPHWWTYSRIGALQRNGPLIFPPLRSTSAELHYVIIYRQEQTTTSNYYELAKKLHFNTMENTVACSELNKLW